VQGGGKDAVPTVPKKYASRPDRTLVALPVSWKPWTSSSGPGEIPSAPLTSMAQRSSWLETPPGYRQLIATIAMGSRAAASSSCGRCREADRSAVARLR
jgi:hypothetical protein